MKTMVMDLMAEHLSWLGIFSNILIFIYFLLLQNGFSMLIILALMFVFAMNKSIRAKAPSVFVIRLIEATMKDSKCLGTSQILVINFKII